MKLSALFVLSLFIGHAVYAQDHTDPVFTALNRAIRNKDQYVKQKEEQISALKRRVTAGLSPFQAYQLNEELYQAYKKLKIDSALSYANKNLHIAEVLHNEQFSDIAQIEIANSHSSSGRYRESEAILKSIRKDRLTKEMLPDYYDAYIQFFEHYATNNYNSEYARQIELYRDSLLGTLAPAAVRYKVNLAQKLIYKGETEPAEKALLQLFKTERTKDAEFAMTAYLLGNIYKLKQRPDLEKKYNIISAIADIKNAVKDNASMQNLALTYYETGDIDNAYRCTKSAIEDAMFCNVRFRTISMSELYSIVNTAYLDKEAKGKTQLKVYLLLISILSGLLLAAIIYVYQQMRKVSVIKERLDLTSQQLAASNGDLSDINRQLHEMNTQLSEANHVKEEYIAQFFDLCSTYINKLENYRKELQKKASGRQLDELFKMLKSTTLVDKEVGELYRTFDHIFLNLYPDFVKEFNSLLIKEEQVMVKHGELLNTELRIFALIRLGITDSVKIAAFLRYSLSTIYNYRTRARNKAAVSRDDFEKMVLKIGVLPVKL